MGLPRANIAYNRSRENTLVDGGFYSLADFVIQIRVLYGLVVVEISWFGWVHVGYLAGV